MNKAILAVFLVVPSLGWATCPTPLTVKDAAGTTQNISTTDDTSGNCQSNVVTTPNSRVVVPLDVATVTTGSTAVNALSAGHATAGGFLITTNAAGICVDQHTTAGTVTGTPSSTICVAQNQVYQLVPNTGAVSVNSTASGVSIAGEGLQ
jgi:hypothetical protein